MVERAESTGNTRLAEDFRGASERDRHSANRLSAASLFWVTSDMATVALDASQDCPGVTASDVPTTTGLICFASPLPAKDTESVGGVRLRDETGTPRPDDHTAPIPVDAIWWSVHGVEVRVELLVKTGRLPGRIYASASRSTLEPFMSLTLPMPADFTKDMTFLGPEGASVSSDSLGVISLLATTWVLMMTPTVASQRDITPPTGGGGASAPDVRDLRTVTLIDLRALRQAPAEDTPADAGSRTYRRRWIVRGHWRQQAVGPKRGDRRATWIPSYIKGPSGAPLIPSEHVSVWRR